MRIFIVIATPIGALVLFLAGFIFCVPLRNWDVFSAARAEAKNYEAEVSPMIHRLLDLSYKNSCVYLSRELINRVPVKERERIDANWQAYFFAWNMSTIGLLGERNCRILISRRYKLGPLGQDLSEAARTAFGKTLNELGLEEAAVLIVISRLPERYIGHPDRLKRMTEDLLGRYRDEP